MFTSVFLCVCVHIQVYLHVFLCALVRISVCVCVLAYVGVCLSLCATPPPLDILSQSEQMECLSTP